MKVLLVSNLDSREPFGQFLRPFHLGRGLARAGVEVGMVGVDCAKVDFGPTWSTHRKSLRPYVGALRRAARTFRPDVVYGHEARGGTAALLAGLGVPVAVDFHSVPSLEWQGYARTSSGAEAVKHRLASRRSAGGERLMARRADAIVAAGQEVAEDVRRLHRPRVDPVVVVNGIVPTLLDARPNGASPYGRRNGARSAVATIPGKEPESNARALDFLQAVAEELTARDTGVSVHVLGSKEGPEARGLHYEGFVPELAPWIANADTCLLPYPREAALAGGPRNKLIEYLAAGRTIVTTQEGLRGLREVADWPGVVVADDDPGAFAAAVVAATRDGVQDLTPRREDVRERLTWDALARQVAPVLEGIAR